jgi:predicted nucleic acid-binding protein
VSFLLDTDICSGYLKGNRIVFNRFIQHSGGLAISTVSLGELYTWALRGNSSPTRFGGIEDMRAIVRVIDVTHDISRTSGQTRAMLLDQGHTVAFADLLIAATALTHDLMLVTYNLRHFSPIPGLRIEDWLSP